MPELPDVEGFRRYLARYAAGRRIDEVDVRDASLVRNASPATLARTVRGHRFGAPRRLGKWLMAPTGDATVAMHFGMTGLLRWSGADPPEHPHDRVVFALAGGWLSYRNQRKLGGIWVAHGEGGLERVTGRLGPDALDVSRDDFGGLLDRRRGALKPALMDQRLIAGLGNLLSDEILWHARLNPRTQAAGLSDAEIDRLYDSMRAVLRESNRHARVPRKQDWLTGVRDDRGARCPRCGAALRRARIAGRTACWCPRDQ